MGERKTNDGTRWFDTPPLNIQQQSLFSPLKNHPLRIGLRSEYVSEQSQVPDFNFNYNYF